MGRERLGIGLGLGSWGGGPGGFFPRTFAIKNKVITFKNFKSNWEFCSTFISFIEIVEHKKHKFPFILLSFVLFNNQTSAKSV